MMNYILCLFLLLYTSVSYAQSPEQDSIQAAQLILDGVEKKDYDEALTCFQKALSLLEKHDDKEKIIATRLRILYLYNRKSMYNEALVLADEGMSLCLDYFGPKDKRFLPQFYDIKAVAFSATGEYDKAIEYNNKVLAFYEKDKQQLKQVSKCYRGLGVAYYYKGNFEKSLAAYQKNKEVIIEMEGSVSANLAALYGNMAALLNAMGRYEDALDLMLEALEINEVDSVQASDAIMARLYNNIAATYVPLRQHSRALEYLDKAEMMYKKTLGPEHPSVINVYANKANIQSRGGNPAAAAVNYAKAIEILEKTRVKPSQLAQLYTNLGVVYNNTKQYDKARAALNKSIEINVQLGGEYYNGAALPYSVLASVCFNEKDIESFYFWEEKALKIHLKVKGPTHPKTAASYRSIANAQTFQKKFETAIQTLETALMANSSNKEATVLEMIEGKYYLGAHEFIDILQGLTLTYAHWYHATKELSYLEKAYQYVLWNQKLVTAVKNNMAKKEDQQSLLKSTHQVNLNGIELAFNFHEAGDAAYLNEALHFAELNKSAILLGVLKDDAAKQFGGLPDSIVHQESVFESKIAQLEKQIIDAQIEQQRTEANQLKGRLLEVREDLHVFQEKIRDQFPQYAALKYEETKIDVALVQKELLNEKTALLEYFVADSIVYLFLITQTKYQVHQLPFRKGELKQYIRQIRQGLSDYKMLMNHTTKLNTQYVTSAFTLYEKLILPVLEELKDIEHLVIVADGEMSNIPFEALLTEVVEKQDVENYSNWEYLCKRFFMSYSYSIAWLLEANKSKHKTINNKMLAIGATYPEEYTELTWRTRRQNELRSTLPSLNSVNSEIKALEDNFEGLFYTKERASERNFKAEAENFGILHLAMHGLLNPQHPMASSLVLTEVQDSLEDNFLHAYEISQMNLKASLVVLSACETGYGKFEQGEGVMSMARSFMYAGVPSLVVSLWQVNDLSTAAIMKVFYHNLSQGQAKDEALTNAKMDYIQRATGLAAHPAFWAPFVQIGTSEAIFIEEKGSWTNYAIGLVLFLGMGLLGLFLKKRRRIA